MAVEILDSAQYQFACSSSDDSRCHWIVWIYRVSWILLVIGTIGNCLNMLVLSQRKMRKISTSVYWAFLGCSDLSCLWLVTFGQTSLVEFDENIQKRGVFLCLMLPWLLFTTAGFSVWLLILLTVERFLYTFYPHSARIKLTTRRAIITSLVTFGVICLSNGHLIFGFTWVPLNDTCVYSSEEYKTFKINGHYYQLLIMYSLIPIIIISAGNIAIACKLKGRSRQILPMSAISQAVTRNNSATKMLFLVNTVFIISTLPYCLFLIFTALLDGSYLESYKIPIQIAEAVVFLLLLCNYTFNFFLYCASGSLFKDEFWKIVRIWRAKLLSRAEPSQEQVTMPTVS